MKASYASAYLEARGYLDNTAGKLTVPVFGLYAGRSNNVTVTVRYADGTSSKVKLAIQTAAYDGGTYSNPVVIQPRLPGTTLSYDFILLKNYSDPITPIIIDTDGEIRWVSPAGLASQVRSFSTTPFMLPVALRSIGRNSTEQPPPWRITRPSAWLDFTITLIQAVKG